MSENYLWSNFGDEHAVRKECVVKVGSEYHIKAESNGTVEYPTILRVSAARNGNLKIRKHTNMACSIEALHAVLHLIEQEL